MKDCKPRGSHNEFILGSAQHPSTTQHNSESGANSHYKNKRHHDITRSKQRIPKQYAPGGPAWTGSGDSTGSSSSAKLASGIPTFVMEISRIPQNSLITQIIPKSHQITSYFTEGEAIYDKQYWSSNGANREMTAISSIQVGDVPNAVLKPASVHVIYTSRPQAVSRLSSGPFSNLFQHLIPPIQHRCLNSKCNQLDLAPDRAPFVNSFSFLQATASWKDFSNSSSEWSLGFTLNSRFAPAM